MSHNLRTVESYIVVAYQLVSRHGLDSNGKTGFFSYFGFCVKFMLVLFAIAILSVILLILQCISVFTVSNSFENLPLSEILVTQA